MTPELFAGTVAADEYGLSLAPGGRQRILTHHRHFITSRDFSWIADHGFTHIRLPVGHWVFGDEAPYVGAVDLVHKALAWAEQYGLKVLLDLHSLPGSQNGQIHSGRAGEIAWHLHSGHIERSLKLLERICKEFGRSSALWGIELINEPHKSIPLNILSAYYSAGQGIVRRNCGPHVAVIVSDGFRPKAMIKRLRKDGLSNIIIDMHFYQTHSLLDKLLGFSRNLRKVRKWRRLIRHASRHYPVIVGEWSGGLGINKKELSRAGKADITRRYIKTQANSYADSAGWFYWNYKVITKEDVNPWSAQQMIEKRILKV
jgi:glucan 1,3-beta-glucosidase